MPAVSMLKVYCSTIFVSLILLTVFLYWPGLNGRFLVDDANNLSALNLRGGVTSWDGLLEFVLGNHSGMLGRPLSMLSFLIDDQYWPGSVMNYRYTNVLIHCLCGVLLFALVRLFLSHCSKPLKQCATELGLIVTAIWLLAPIHVSTTLYVVQRMTQLSAVFCLAGLCLFIVGRKRLAEGDVRGRYWVLIGLYFFGALAVLSKENGALIFCFALVLEYTFAYYRQEKPLPFVLLVAVIPIILGIIYFIISLPSFTNTSAREFSIVERLLTESRILWDYIFKIVIPIKGNMGLVYDDIVISSSLFSPITTLFSVFAHAVVILGAFAYRKRLPWFFLAVFGFYTGHLLESTVIPLELYYEHRNYLPSIFLLIGLVVFITEFFSFHRSAIIVFVVLIVFSIIMLSQRVAIWGNPALQTRIWAAEHPESIKSQTDLFRLQLLEGEYASANKLLTDMQSRWPLYRHINVLLITYRCLGILPNPGVGKQQLSEFAVEGVYSGNLPSATESLIKLYRTGSCSALGHEEMLQILSSLYKLEYSKKRYNASIQFWMSEVYARMGDLNGAIRSLEQAIREKNRPMYYYQKSILLESAGLYSEALSEISIALRMERLKPIYRQFDIEKYEFVRHRLNGALQSD